MKNLQCSRILRLLSLFVLLAVSRGDAPAQDAYFQLDSKTATRILDVNRGGLITWSNSVVPTSFYLLGAQSLGPAGAWHRIAYGETSNRIGTIEAPLADRLVLFGLMPRGTDLWVGKLFDTWRKQIKSGGRRAELAAISKDDRYILYTEDNASGTDYAVQLYDVVSDTTVGSVAQAGRAVDFDHQNESFFFYIGNPPTAIFRRALDGRTDTSWITDAGHTISAFQESPDGSRILVKSGDTDTPYLDRFALFTHQGTLERLLLEASFDGYNFSFNNAGDRIVVSYREPDCSGQPHVIVYDLNTGGSSELPSVAAQWSKASCALFIGWSPYDELVTLQPNLFFSPTDGRVTGSYSVPAGYSLLGVDSDQRWYVTDPSLSEILGLTRNP